MAVIADPEFWLRLLSISVLNILLSGDNALVIALAVRALPKRKRVVGQIWGAAGAVVLRLVFVAIVSALLRVPLLQLLGGLLLLWIAVRLVRPDTGDAGSGRHGGSLWEAIWIIIVADVTMSLDNVLAIAAASHGDLVLVMFGIGLSLPIVVWGAGLDADLRGDRSPGEADDRRGPAQERRPAPARAGPRREVRGEPHLGPRGAARAREPRPAREPAG